MLYATCLVLHVTWNHYSQTVKAKDLQFLNNLKKKTLCVTCHMRSVTCHVPQIIRKNI